MISEARTCQNCKEQFAIEPEDFGFYEKIQVPPPTWCPECQFQRRLMWRNERTLYKRFCNVPNHAEQLISIYSADKPLTVYESDFWWSDNWDPMSFGRDYDFSRPFFAQFEELIQAVPWPALLNWNMLNCSYCNMTTDNKNCYFVFGGDFNENCFHSTFNFHNKDSAEIYWADKCELCYELVYSNNCYRVSFSRYASNCSDSLFLLNCTNCDNCLGCVNLRNKSHCIFNEQYSKDGYEKKIKELDIGSFSGFVVVRENFKNFTHQLPVRFAEIMKSTDCTGNNIHNAKNCKNCFDVYDNAENLKNISIAGWGLHGALNCNHLGHNTELAYDATAVFSQASHITLSAIISSSHDISYSYNCRRSRNLFGCISLKDKSYCLLNKKYTKEEYEALVPKITKHMNAMPYVDKKGRIYRYGEFFPPELSPFAYNETIAQEYFPLTKDQAISQGYKWRDPDTKEYQVTLLPANLPDHIKEVKDDILQETIGCAHKGECPHQCTTAFKIIPEELSFYRRMNLSLPRLCPNCRHYERLKQRNPLKLWHRKCQCAGRGSGNEVYRNTAAHQHGAGACPNEFETSYAPDRKEIVYCEACYNGEVV